MEYEGKQLILDNFRAILTGYSVDVQDVVRSAILDGVDISQYISQCRNNPYRLDQIRLALKDGVEEDFLGVSSGEILYRIRGLLKKGADGNILKRYVNKVNQETLKYLLSWTEDGVAIGNLNLAIIPGDMLEVFDYGLRNGYSMEEFNTGAKFSAEYVKALLRIKANKKPIETFIKESWDLAVIKQLSVYSAVMNFQTWNRLVKNIDSSTPEDRVIKLIKCVSNGVPIKTINQRGEDGEYIYETACIPILLEGYINKLDCRCLLSQTTASGMQSLYDEMELEKRKTQSISGRVRKHYS